MKSYCSNWMQTVSREEGILAVDDTVEMICSPVFCSVNTRRFISHIVRYLTPTDRPPPSYLARSNTGTKLAAIHANKSINKSTNLARFMLFVLRYQDQIQLVTYGMAACGT